MSHEGIAVIIFILVMAAVISEKIHRTVAALCGTVLLFIFDVLSAKEIVTGVDWNTIGLLLGMMCFVAVAKRSGIFELMAVKAAVLTGGRAWSFMIVMVLMTALLSAILDNVTTVLLMGPVTIVTARQMGLEPVPFLLAQVFASNIGGTATLIGDPPNIMIGSAANLGFLDFLQHNGPIIVMVLILELIWLRICYRGHLQDRTGNLSLPIRTEKVQYDRSLALKSMLVMTLVIVGFLIHDKLHVSSAVIALGAGALMLIIGRQPIRKVVCDIEWKTIGFFLGLFPVVEGLVKTGVIRELAELVIRLTNGREVIAVLIVLWASAVLSSVLDNIPFVAAMIPLIHSLGNSGMAVEPLWWALSLGACLGGNGTLVGASANVVLTGISEKNGYPVSYLQFLKVGFPLMLLSIVVCTVYLIC